MKKRSIVALLLCLVMVFSLMAACGGETEPSTAPSTAPSAAPEADPSSEPEADPTGEPTGEELEPYKIGLLIWSTTNSWARGVIDALEYMGEALNCEIVTMEGGNGGEETLTAIENLCAAGCDALVLQQGAGLGSSIIDLCTEYGIYFVNTCDDWSADPNYEQLLECPYYVGGFYEDEYGTAYDLATLMGEQGAEKFAILSMPEGTAASFDNRAAGAKDAIADMGKELVSEARGFNKAENAQNIIAQYPDVDAILCSFDAVETCVQPITAAGMTGQVMLSSCGTADGALEALEDGNKIYICDGTRGDAMLAFTLLYDALTSGGAMTDADGSKASQTVNYIIVSTPEDFTLMTQKITEEDYPFYVDELKQLIRRFNPDATLDDYAELATNYSLEDVIARHG